MTDDPKPPPASQTTEFSLEQWSAFDLSSTISVPSAHNPSARLFYGVRFLPPVGHRTFEPRFYFKAVQVIHERELITRTFDKSSVQAIRYLAPPPEKGSPAPPGWTLKTTLELTSFFENIESELVKKAERDARALAWNDDMPPLASQEVTLFDQAFIYVPPSAPVLLRRDSGVTAAEAEEICAGRGPCL
jgi:hypothetical protein